MPEGPLGFSRLTDIGPLVKPSGNYTCECIECGHTIETDEHCNTLSCPECDGDMRRAERPGPGR